MNVILIAVIVLGALGLISALVLFYASHKFAVHEDPRIGQVSEVLPSPPSNPLTKQGRTQSKKTRWWTDG